MTGLSARDQRRRCSLCHVLLGPGEGDMRLLPGFIGKARGGGQWRLCCLAKAECERRAKREIGR